MDVTIEEISQYLIDYSISTDDPEVLRKLKELCFVYGGTAEDIVAEWIAYSMSKTVKKDCNPPTLVLLEQMDKEKEMNKNSKSRKSHQSVSTPVFNSKTIDLTSSANFETPVSERKNFSLLDQSVQFSPNTLSPTCFTPSRKYSTRNNVGDVVLSFGNTEDVEWKHSDEFSCSVTAFSESCALRKSYNFMCEKLRDYASILNDSMQESMKLFEKEYQIENWGHIQLPSVETVPVVGRICSDSSGRLNAHSLLLEGSQEICSGQTIPLDVSNLEKFSFFPGQIVSGTGINNSGKKFILKSLNEGVYPPSTPKVPDLENCYDSLSVVIAAGPFATSDTLSYQPLIDLLKYVKEHKPHTVILVGPLVDVKNELLENTELNETFDDVFKTVISEILKNIENLSTKVVLVPSSRDAHHDCIYPTPPYSVNNSNKRLYLASDPCILNIEGVIFAVTATDILFHLGKEEISYPQLPDRLGRLCNHILTQRHFYPLYPPNEDVNIDYLHYESNAALPVMPHILVLPSDFRYFIKEINGCCCINPERLTKHSTGGTFARIKVKPINESKCAEKPSIVDSIQAQIVKI